MKVYGLYSTLPEIVSAVNALKSKGYKGQDITIAAEDDRLFGKPGEPLDADVDTVTMDDSFMDKILNVFSSDPETNIEERLKDFGIPAEERSFYSKKLDEGKVLILIDESVAGTDPVVENMTNDTDPNLGANKLSADQRLIDEDRETPMMDERFDAHRRI
ncbi:MAG: general stress protein [Bacillus sp. (in: firmicutes)]